MIYTHDNRDDDGTDSDSAAERADDPTANTLFEQFEDTVRSIDALEPGESQHGLGRIEGANAAVTYHYTVSTGLETYFETDTDERECGGERQ